MSISIEIKCEKPSVNLHLSDDQQMLYCGDSYHKFLLKLLPDADFFYVWLCENSSLVGYIPIVVQKVKFGKIANSLPFFGSHGGVISVNQISKNLAASLVEFFDDWTQREAITSFTIVENPTFDQPHFWRKFESGTNFFRAFSDERLSQITHLPCLEGGEDIDEKIMSLFHSKTRNMVRKSLRQDFSIQEDNSPQAFHELYQLHRQNMEEIGGKPKPWSVFEQIRNNFVAGQEFQIYRAKTNDGNTAGMLLLLFASKYIEYFTPVISPVNRSAQPMSFLIYSAMKSAVLGNQFRYWNWGGTWLSQDGVYRFKKRWGAQEKKYRYISWVRKSQCEDIVKNLDTYIQQTPFFYICPKAISESKIVY